MQNLSLVYFSPTGNTKKIIQEIARGIALPVVQNLDLTLPRIREEEQYLCTGDLVLLGVPVYEGTVPQPAAAGLSKLQGNGKPVVLLVVYGNVEEGTALKDLEKIAAAAGFNVVGGAAFVAEHSFSHLDLPVAKDRPDELDLGTARDFGYRLWQKSLAENGVLPQVVMPEGQRHWLARLLPAGAANRFTASPDAERRLCTECHLCVYYCPVAAIDSASLQINNDKCLRCFACVRKCPRQARHIHLQKKAVVRTVLGRLSRERKEPRIYL